MKSLFTAALVLALAGCGGSGHSDVPKIPHLTRDQLFVKIVKERAPDYQNASPRLLIKTAHQECQLFDAGATLGDAAAFFVSGGLTTHDAGVFSGAAIAAYCPDHRDLLK